MELIHLTSKLNFTENQQQLRKMTLRDILSFPKLMSIKHISTGYIPHTVDLEYKEENREQSRPPPLELSVHQFSQRNNVKFINEHKSRGL